MLLYTVIILCGVLLLCLWHGLKRPIYFLSYGYALSMLCQSACLLWLYKGCVSHVLVLLHAMLFIGYGLRLLFYLIVHSFNTVYNTMGAAQAHCTLSIPRSVLLMCACSFLFFCMVSPLLSVLLSVHCGNPIHKATQCIGVLSMLLGFSLESVADYQKSHYGRPHPELYCARGLFYYVRMPNYLGEILFWVGNCVVSASTSTCAFLLLCNTIGSLFSITIMLFSAFDLDAKQLRYSQKDPEYIAYRNRTHSIRSSDSPIKPPIKCTLDPQSKHTPLFQFGVPGSTDEVVTQLIGKRVFSNSLAHDVIASFSPFLFGLTILLSVVLADKYAIIFQGDRGYGNYSDSSNTCRAYDDIIASGIPADHVIYMANEATLSDGQNPWPGKLFTLSDPDGEGWDHAAGCKEHFDYQGKMIEPEVVLAVIRQDEEKVKSLTGLENPKVFHTTEEDTLFIYYSDHGYEGGVGCGNGRITTKQMQDALKYLHENNKYSKMAFFLEACESGSVFDTLPSNLNIYAFTSANQTEPAWCDYCPPNDVVNHKSIGVCMSMYYDNEYQLLWEQESTTITLGELFQKTHDEVAKYKHQEVSEWGDLSMRDLPMTTFIGDKPIKTRNSAKPSASSTRVEKSEAPIHEAKWRAIRADSNSNAAAFDELRELLNTRAKEEVEVMRLGAAVLGEKKMGEKLNVDTYKYDRECASEMFNALLSECKHSLPFPATTRQLVHAICEKGIHQDVKWSEICL